MRSTAPPPRKLRAGVETAKRCVRARATSLSDWTWSVTLQVANSFAQCLIATSTASAPTMPCEADSPSGNFNCSASPISTGDFNALMTLLFTSRTAPKPSGLASVMTDAVGYFLVSSLNFFVGFSVAELR